MILLKEGDEDLEPDLGKNKKTHDKIDKQYPNGSSPLSHTASPRKRESVTKNLTQIFDVLEIRLLMP